jgi:hypothetical protein
VEASPNKAASHLLAKNLGSGLVDALLHAVLSRAGLLEEFSQGVVDAAELILRSAHTFGISLKFLIASFDHGAGKGKATADSSTRTGDGRVNAGYPCILDHKSAIGTASFERRCAHANRNSAGSYLCRTTHNTGRKVEAGLDADILGLLFYILDLGFGLEGLGISVLLALVGGKVLDEGKIRRSEGGRSSANVKAEVPFVDRRSSLGSSSVTLSSKSQKVMPSVIIVLANLSKSALVLPVCSVYCAARAS